MRAITADTARELTKQHGIELSILLKVYWSNDDIRYYADKANGPVGVEGRILELSPLESVTSLDVSSVSSLSVKLDDSDSFFRNKFNTVDIHKLKVEVYLWRPTSAPSRASLLFTGYANTPFVWSEGDRTFSMSIVSQLESYEIGFAIDQGYSRWIPQELYGQPFPLIFGTVQRYSLMRLTEPPQLILKAGIGFAFSEAWDAEIIDLSARENELFNLSVSAFAEGEATARAAAGYNDGTDTFTPPDDYETYVSLLAAANELYSQSGQYMNERLTVQYQKLALINEREQMLEKYGEGGNQSVAVYTENIYLPQTNMDQREDPSDFPPQPAGFQNIYEVNNERFTAQIRDSGTGALSLDNIKYVETRNIKKPKPFFESQTVGTVVKKTTSNDVGAPQKFIWIDGGTVVRMVGLPITYAIGIGDCQIINVYSLKDGIPVRVDPKYYKKSSILAGDSLRPESVVTITTLETTGLLSALRDAQGENLYDSDDIWADVQGPLPGEFGVIAQYIVSKYTNLSLSSNFLSEVNPAGEYKMNFVYTSQEDALAFLKKLAYQARVSLWVSNGTIFARYLPKKPTTNLTIEPADVIENTLELGSTPTENVVTKYIAEWRYNAGQRSTNKFIIRHNMKKYGYSEQNYSYFAYTNPGTVEKIAAYWAVQSATVYKTMRFRCFLYKINIEAQDAVRLIGFGGILGCEEPITGIVQSAVYDSDSQIIDMEVKLPIRLGDTCPYDFAYPFDVTRLYREEKLPEYETGSPYEGVRNNFFNITNPYIFMSRGPSPPSWSGNPIDISDNFNDEPSAIRPPIDTTIVNRDSPVFDTTRPPFVDTINRISNYDIIPFKKPTLPTNPGTTAKAGIVMDNLGGNIYNVQFLGATEVTPVTQIQIHPDYVIPAGTAVICIRQSGGYVMQSPVWVARG